METKEKNLEQDIESWLLSEGGYVKGTMATYDKKRAIDMPVLIKFIEATQPKQWERYKNIYGEQAEHQLYKMFQNNVAQSGLIYVLRNGIKDRGIGLKFVYFEPASGLNEELVEKYQANIERYSCGGFGTEEPVYRSDGGELEAPVYVRPRP